MLAAGEPETMSPNQVDITERLAGYCAADLGLSQGTDLRYAWFVDLEAGGPPCQVDRTALPPARARSFGIASDERFCRLLHLVEADRLPPAAFGAKLDKDGVLQTLRQLAGTGCGRTRRVSRWPRNVAGPRHRKLLTTRPRSHDNQTKTSAALDHGEAGWEVLDARSDIEAIPYDQGIATAAFHALLADADGVALGLTSFGEAELTAARRCASWRATVSATTRWT